MASVPFTKANACGNDFLIIDGRYAPADLGQFSREICDRHNGVGADGVEWLFPGEGAEAALRLINADGSEAEISGNGTRCVAAYLVATGGPHQLMIRTAAGVKRCELISRSGNRFEFEMAMGKPAVTEPFYVTLSSGKVQGTPVSVGNPHFVVLVTELPAAWQKQAAEIQRQPNFPDGVNVEFARMAGPGGLEVRFFERGVGETQSSGTGSCASAVAAIAAGMVQPPVAVAAPGGTQIVRWDGGDVSLRGPARLVCRGEYLA